MRHLLVWSLRPVPGPLGPHIEGRAERRPDLDGYLEAVWDLPPWRQRDQRILRRSEINVGRLGPYHRVLVCAFACRDGVCIVVSILRAFDFRYADSADLKPFLGTSTVPQLFTGSAVRTAALAASCAFWYSAAAALCRRQ